MKNFDWTCFTKKILVHADVQTLYDAWTKSDELEKWFLSKSRFYSANGDLVASTISVEEGYGYTWNWFLFEPSESGKITSANGKDQLQFTFAGNCLVDIQLEAYGEDTLVTLHQKNIPTDEISRQNIRLGCDSGWAFYLVNLKSVYEQGADLRNKNPAFLGMVNS